MKILDILANRKMLIMALFGFSSGLPVALVAGTLQAWLADEGLSIQTIGILTLVGQPYFYKFLWAPVMDRFAPMFLAKFFGRRRSWILITQVALMVGLVWMGLSNPGQEPLLVGLVALIVAFVSASQDVVIDAYRTEILTPEERGAALALFVSCWRIAALVSGAGALILADQLGWMATYNIMALLMLVGIIATFLAQEPDLSSTSVHRTLREAVVAPLQDFLQRDKALLLLLLVVLYKLADAFAAQLMTAFFTGGADIQGLGFSKTEVGLIGKGWGFAATILGASLAGVLMIRWRLFTSLLVFGFFQAASNLMFVWLAVAGKNHTLLIATVFIENFCAGMGTTALLALLTGLCNPHFAVAQYALLSAFAAVGTRFLGPLAGYLVAEVGWVQFFIWSFVAAIPSLALILYMRDTIGQYDVRKKD